MSSILSSPGVVLATAVALSGTVIFLAFRRERNFHPTQFSGNQDSHHAKQILRSCLSSDGKKRDRKKKRVQFADSVKNQTGNGEDYRKEHEKYTTLGIHRSCRGQIHGIPANQVALYNGIIRDRVQGMECSY